MIFKMVTYILAFLGEQLEAASGIAVGENEDDRYRGLVPILSIDKRIAKGAQIQPTMSWRALERSQAA